MGKRLEKGGYEAAKSFGLLPGKTFNTKLRAARESKTRDLEFFKCFLEQFEVVD